MMQQAANTAVSSIFGKCNFIDFGVYVDVEMKRCPVSSRALKIQSTYTLLYIAFPVRCLFLCDVQLKIRKSLKIFLLYGEGIVYPFRR